MKGARVLVVEDEKQALELVTRYLTARGLRVLGADSAERALDLARAGPVDFVLLDVILPGKTGHQALVELRGLTKAPIHLMSGLCDDDTKRDGLLLGAAGFFAKPLDLQAVVAAIEAVPETPA